MLARLDRLPVCLCHHDAFRRNLMAYDPAGTGTDGTNSGPQTLAVDWSMLGYGGVGEETAMTTAVNLLWTEVAAEQASELDQTIFAYYVDGLRDAGWRGDERLARFGYTAAASLAMGASMAVGNATMLSMEGGIQNVELMIGHPIDHIYEQWATVVPFLLDLGDEALRLTGELG